MTASAWPVADPFLTRRVAGATDLDEFGHMNNVRYVAWALEAAWAHSNALGVSFADYKRAGVGCVVWRQEFEYLAPVVEGDEIDVATWIAENDGRLKLVRAYEMRLGDGSCVFRGRTTFVSINMTTGRPARMPAEFVRAYRPAE